MLQVPRAGGEWGIGDAPVVVIYFSVWSPTTPGSENSVAGEGRSRGPCQRQQFLSPVSLGGGGEGSNKSKGLARATAPPLPATPFSEHSVAGRGGIPPPPNDTEVIISSRFKFETFPGGICLRFFFREFSRSRHPEGLRSSP